MNTKRIALTGLLSMAVALMSGALLADDSLYELVNDADGYSYIKFNADVQDFAFKSDFKSIGNSGKVGYYILPDGLSAQEAKEYIAKLEMNDAQFGKKINDGIVDLGERQNGERVGFYLQRNNGDLVRGWSFQDAKGTTYIAFDKNGGHGKDEWMSIEDISVIPRTDIPTGAPLPGVLTMLLLGGASAGVLKLRKRKQM